MRRVNENLGLLALAVLAVGLALPAPVIAQEGVDGDIVDIVGGTDPRLVNGVLISSAQGDRTEWGYWTREFGYTRLGWSIKVDEAGTLAFEVPTGGPVTAAQLRRLIAPITTEEAEGTPTPHRTPTPRPGSGATPAAPDVVGGSNPRLSRGYLIAAPAGDRTEWGYWNQEYGYTRLGWTIKVSEDGTLAYEVPEDGPITAAQLQQLVSPVAEEEGTPTPGTSGDAESVPGVVDIVGGSNPRLTGGALISRAEGDRTEWGYWNQEHGYTRLGWTIKVSEDGTLAYEVPEDGPITAAQLRALLTQ